MLAAIKHGLGNLVNFNGRDARQAFWYYVLFIYIVTVVLTMIVTVPLMMNAIFTAASSASMGQSPEAAQMAVMASMQDMMPKIVWMSFGTNFIMVLLLGASLVRRLHDSNLSGWLALIPAGLQLAVLAMIPQQLKAIERMMESMATTPQAADPFIGFRMMQGSAGLGALLGYAALGIVIYFGVRKSTEGPNQYGAAPFTA